MIDFVWGPSLAPPSDAGGADNTSTAHKTDPPSDSTTASFHTEGTTVETNAVNALNSPVRASPSPSPRAATSTEIDSTTSIDTTRVGNQPNGHSSVCLICLDERGFLQTWLLYGSTVGCIKNEQLHDPALGSLTG